jgi:hypothetical protein
MLEIFLQFILGDQPFRVMMLSMAIISTPLEMANSSGARFSALRVFPP